MPAVIEPDDDVLSRGDLDAILDEDARRLLGLSGAEFRQRLAAGTLPEHPAVAHLALLTGAGAC